MVLEYLPFRAMAEPTRMMLAYGGIPYEDRIVWGQTFRERRNAGAYPFDQVPVLWLGQSRVAQSGAIARYAATLAGCLGSTSTPEDVLFNDHIFDYAQDMCTINPLINCYSGREFAHVKQRYGEMLPNFLEKLETQLRIRRQFQRQREKDEDVNVDEETFFCCYFGGAEPSHADFNVYHMLSNAELVYPEVIMEFPQLKQWMRRDMEGIDTDTDVVGNEKMERFRAFLRNRPKLRNIGQSGPPSHGGVHLEDRNGRKINQMLDYDASVQALTNNGGKSEFVRLSSDGLFY